MGQTSGITAELSQRFGDGAFREQHTRDAMPTIWAGRERLADILRYLKNDVAKPYRMLFDLTGIDERQRQHRDGQPEADFTVVYQLLSFERNEDVRVKVALSEPDLNLPSAVSIWPNANWYERECWDMFGINFEGHPHLTRILMPPMWDGHPLRKDHHARATETLPYWLDDEKEEREQEALKFNPEDWGLTRQSEGTDFMFLNIGPNHPSAHGVFRVVVQLDGEEIVEAVPDIGYHHRGAEKMGERQSWHTFIPYTDRIDYIGGVMNNLPYVLAAEKLAGIDVPDRVKVMRIMLCELFRISSHLLFLATYSQDLGAMSPVFYGFSDRQRCYEVIEPICGFRMHPAFFRIGGVAMDLPDGWERLVREFVDYMPKRLKEYEGLLFKNKIFRARSRGIGAYDTNQAMDWGATGAGLRATGMEWDMRKARPYSGYEQFDFEVPVGANGDCYDRCWVRLMEMHQSVRIIRQCMDNMPAGEYKSRHRLTTPPLKDYTMHDIETLITHFVNTSWGPVMPEGEACQTIEATKGLNSYYLVSDGSTASYRTRIRTPSFAHLQMIPTMTRGHMVPDLVASLGSIDFVMADVDR
jgi:NADH-quinone oxidoreductase subunit C/D